MSADGPRTKLLALLALVGTLVWMPSDASARQSHADFAPLEILYQTSFAAGDAAWLNGETGWFRPTNCPNKPVATLTDALGHSFNLGAIEESQSLRTAARGSRRRLRSRTSAAAVNHLVRSRSRRRRAWVSHR